MTATAQLPDHFKVLIDAPYDGCAEEWCWVPVEFAPTEEEAVALARAEGVIGTGLGLVCHGREHWRRDPAYKRHSDYLWRNEREDIDLDYEPWLPCTRHAKTGIEVWRFEVTDDPDAPPRKDAER